MHFTSILASLVSVGSLVRSAAADLRITANNHSFGGVNFPQLQFLQPRYRDEVIRTIVRSNARVIRLFIRPDDAHPDAEPELGGFDRSMLDQFDDTLAAIHHLSKGQVKVIIAPHDAHALRGTNGVPCDAYCKKLDGAFLDFYSVDDYRELYKTRLEVFFRHYPSKNFDGRPWAELSEIILGVDIQNEPWSGIWPIVAGETWLCDMATHLKDTLGLGENNIAVITGGISGAQMPEGIQNFPDSAIDCPAVDVIGIHGYYAQESDATAGTPWASIFLPNNTLTSRVLGKKLLLVEEWSYMNTDNGLAYKKQAIFDQGNALNYRGIPWLYSHLTIRDEGTTARINPLREPQSSFAIGPLVNVLRHAYKARSNFNWSKYLPAPPTGLSNLTLVPLNPYIPEQSDCVFGCEGFLCDSADGCRTDLICKNSICQVPSESQPGKVGDVCNSKKVCQEHLKCESGTCQECDSRPTIQPDDPRKVKVYNDPNAQCRADKNTLLQTRSYCTLPSASNPRGNPCTNAAHCDANQYCDWGLCKRCTEGCLGMPCKSNNKCKTGFCNSYGRCDYPGMKKIVSGPGAYARDWTRNRKGAGWNVGGRKDDVRGPNKVRDEAMKINIPKETVQATGQPAATA
ncbi:glycoside hydrolase family 5 protein [Lentithecium fluviatile CBS 122367]|uniref:Glycoside hydrolase family 5 protein n=1 Tax=Lentithecium fluviatile CBS 122367 TaxID=1168545 RepID=A0A6G1JHD7_9PLEO|nr:glycoside hydrolase family 5 protein [Lentithecium fluviatile CBS 122367]